MENAELHRIYNEANAYAIRRAQKERKRVWGEIKKVAKEDIRGIKERSMRYKLEDYLDDHPHRSVNGIGRSGSNKPGRLDNYLPHEKI